MNAKPMIGSWEVPCIERISTLERRRMASVAVPGLLGDLHQDLGASSLGAEICGSLHGDDARDDFLNKLRDPFRAGQPVAFVADILTATELKQVVIVALDVEESNDGADSFRYRIGLREYVKPPEPAPATDEVGAELGPELDDLAAKGLDGLELPGLLASIPDLGDPVPPLRQSLDGLKEPAKKIADLLQPLKDLLGS